MVRLDDKLLAEVKKMAADSGQTLTAAIEDALREVVARHKRRRQNGPLHLSTFAGHGLQPGVDLDSSSTLLDLMENKD